MATYATTGIELPDFSAMDLASDGYFASGLKFYNPSTSDVPDFFPIEISPVVYLNSAQKFYVPGAIALPDFFPMDVSTGPYLQTAFRGYGTQGVDSFLLDLVIYNPAEHSVELNFENHLPYGPHLIAPKDGSRNRLGSPLMVWTRVAESIYYEVFVARDSAFKQRVARIDVVGTQLQRGWAFGGTYYWRVRAVRGSAFSEFSETWSFTVMPLIPVPISTHNPDGRDRMLNQFLENAQ